MLKTRMRWMAWILFFVSLSIATYKLTRKSNVLSPVKLEFGFADIIVCEEFGLTAANFTLIKPISLEIVQIEDGRITKIETIHNTAPHSAINNYELSDGTRKLKIEIAREKVLSVKLTIYDSTKAIATRWVNLVRQSYPDLNVTIVHHNYF